MITVKDVKYNDYKADIQVDEALYKKIRSDTAAELLSKIAKCEWIGSTDIIDMIIEIKGE